MRVAGRVETTDKETAEVQSSAVSSRGNILIYRFYLSMLFMALPPIPILPLIFLLEVFVIDVDHVPSFQPVPIRIILDFVPVVIVLVIGIVHASGLFLVPFVIILWCGHGKGTHRRHQCSRQKQRSYIFISTLHSSPPVAPTRMSTDVVGLEWKSPEV